DLTTEPPEITEKDVFLCDLWGLCGSKNHKWFRTNTPIEICSNFSAPGIKLWMRNDRYNRDLPSEDHSTKIHDKPQTCGFAHKIQILFLLELLPGCYNHGCARKDVLDFFPSIQELFVLLSIQSFLSLEHSRISN